MGRPTLHTASFPPASTFTQTFAPRGGVKMFSGSPAKKIKSSSSSSKRKFTAGNPLWPCPSIVCVPGLLKAVPKTNGGFFSPCDQKDSQDLTTCQVSCTILSARGSDPPICQLCLTSVGGTPSLGVLSGEKNSQGRDGKQLSTCPMLLFLRHSVTRTESARC